MLSLGGEDESFGEDMLSICVVVVVIVRCRYIYIYSLGPKRFKDGFN